MAWEYEGLFDAIPTNEDNLLGEYWRSEATNIRVGSMGYRTATTKAGTRLEADIYPIYGKAMEQVAKKAIKRGTPDSMKKLNIRNAKRRLILLIEENFNVMEDDTFTLTYAEEPEDLKRCRKDFRNFMMRVRRWREKNGLPELKCMWTIGRDADQRMHIHGIMNGGIDQKRIIKLWGKGIVNSSPLQTWDKGPEGYANYLYKQNELAKARGEREYLHMWSGTRNLKTKIKEHKSDSKVSNRKVKLLARYFNADAKQVMEKIYPGYVLMEHNVHFSDIVDGVYIHCVMRKVEGYNAKREKNQKRPAHNKQVHEEAAGHAEGDLQEGGDHMPGRPS